VQVIIGISPPCSAWNSRLILPETAFHPRHLKAGLGRAATRVGSQVQIRSKPVQCEVESHRGTQSTRVDVAALEPLVADLLSIGNVLGVVGQMVMWS
jgi:hypothetical protein